MNNIETIDGIKGEWRTVTKASEVTVGQRVRYERESNKARFGYKIPHFITDIKNNEVGTKGDGWDRNIFNGYWTNIQSFFPLPVKQKSKVAKAYIVFINCGKYFVKCRIGDYHCERQRYYSSRKNALRGAQRFCKAIGYEMEAVK